MRWAEVDIEKRLWTARAKNNRQHSVPLSDAALNVLRGGAPSFDELAGPVFGPIGFSQAKKHLDALLLPGIPAFTIHDLRRTAASGLAALGVQLPVIEKVLNHQSGSSCGVCGVYQLHRYSAEKRAALDLWSEHVKRLGTAPEGLPFTA
jgi:integrase